jgi:transcriptional regulator with XRE-family HTH domain
MTRTGDSTGTADDFGERLRRRRVAARITQESLAEIAGVSVRTIRDIESGRTGSPRASTQRQIEDALARQRTITAARDAGIFRAKLRDLDGEY